MSVFRVEKNKNYTVMANYHLSITNNTKMNNSQEVLKNGNYSSKR